MKEELYFEITNGPDIIKIEPLRWTHSDAEIDWDKNWIQSRITVKGGAFRGQFNCDLMTTEFELFKRELKTLYSKLTGQATFKTLEGQIEIKIEGDGLGHLTIDCEAMDEAGIGNRLNIAMSCDQTQIPDYLRQLDKIIKEFPIRGTELKIRNE